MKNKILKNLWVCAEILIMFYGFLSICNWDYNITNWNGLSHFLVACASLITFYTIFE